VWTCFSSSNRMFHMLQADPEVDPRLSLRDIVNLPGHSDSARRPFSAHSPAAVTPESPIKAAGSQLRPGTARSAVGAEPVFSKGAGFSGYAAGGRHQQHANRSRDASRDDSPGPDATELGSFAAVGRPDGKSGGGDGGGRGGGSVRSTLGQSFTFTAVGEQLRSPTMPSAPLSPADANDSRFTAGSRAAAAQGTMHAGINVPAPKGKDRNLQAAGGSGHGDGTILAAPSARAQQQPALGQWARRQRLTVRVPQYPE
jgi:hypothetical protein